MNYANFVLYFGIIENVMEVFNENRYLFLAMNNLWHLPIKLKLTSKVGLNISHETKIFF